MLASWVATLEIKHNCKSSTGSLAGMKPAYFFKAHSRHQNILVFNEACKHVLCLGINEPFLSNAAEQQLTDRQLHVSIRGSEQQLFGLGPCGRCLFSRFVLQPYVVTKEGELTFLQSLLRFLNCSHRLLYKISAATIA